MSKARCGMIEGWIELRSLIFKPRTVILLTGLIAVLLSYLLPLKLLSGNYKEGLHAAEPFVLMMNMSGIAGGPMFYIYAVFIVIFSDFPLFSDGFRYRMVRMGREAWIIGEIVTVVLFSLIYMLLIMGICTMPFIGKISLQEGWSRCAQDISTGAWRKIIQIDEMKLYLPEGFLTEYSPMAAFGLSNMYMLAYLLFSAFFIAAFHTFFPRMRPIGVGIMGLNYLLGYFTYEGIGEWIEKVSLVHMSRLRFLNEAYNELAVSLQYANAVWSIVLTAIIICLVIAAKRFKPEDLIEREN